MNCQVVLACGCPVIDEPCIVERQEEHLVTGDPTYEIRSLAPVHGLPCRIDGTTVDPAHGLGIEVDQHRRQPLLSPVFEVDDAALSVGMLYKLRRVERLVTKRAEFHCVMQGRVARHTGRS